MFEIDAKRFIEILATLERVDALGDQVNEATEKIDDSTRKMALDHIESVINITKAFGARAALARAERFYKSLKDREVLTYKEIGDISGEIFSRLKDEISGRPILYIEPRWKDFHNAQEIFGDEVIRSFPSATYDITEAGKCLALSRSTASAFHSMRVIEIGIRSVARCLGIPDPLKPAERNWGNVLRTVKDEIEKRWPGAATRQSGDGHVFDALYTSLDAMKNPWRNATMHVEATYTEEEAEDIFRAVRSFMRKLTARCDELGTPFA